jgi:hypothetical protein
MYSGVPQKARDILCQQLHIELDQMKMHTIGSLVIAHVELAKSEVAERDVASVVKKNVLRLQVAIDNVPAMEVLQRAEKLGGVIPTPNLVELALTLEVVKELAAVHCIKKQN